jgi:hypothetical protein
MQGDSEYHQLTLKRVIDLSLNRNLNEMKGHHLQNLSGPINVKLIMSYIEPINSRFLTIYFE